MTPVNISLRLLRTTLNYKKVMFETIGEAIKGDPVRRKIAYGNESAERVPVRTPALLTRAFKEFNVCLGKARSRLRRIPWFSAFNAINVL